MPTEGLLCGPFDVQRKAEREEGRQRKKGGQRITLLRTRKDKDVSVAIAVWGIQGHLVFFSLFCIVLQIMYSEQFFSNSKKVMNGLTRWLSG